jgi:hypothetical protein
MLRMEAIIGQTIFEQDAQFLGDTAAFLPSRLADNLIIISCT